jgi:hypothetical protein
MSSRALDRVLVSTPLVVFVTVGVAGCSAAGRTDFRTRPFEDVLSLIMQA